MSRPSHSDRPLPEDVSEALARKDWSAVGTAIVRLESNVAADVILRVDSDQRERVLQALAQACDNEPHTDFLHEPFKTIIGKRLGWLVVLMIGQMFTAQVINYFDEQLEKALVLALFIPMITSSGGNSGSQASTLLIRAMGMGEVRLRDWWRVLSREFLVGGVLGLALGVVAFGRIALTNQGYGPHWISIGLTISLSTAAVVLCGSLLGSLLPLILRAFRTDPATSSAPFVATLADVLGLIIYFSIAILILTGTIL